MRSVRNTVFIAAMVAGLAASSDAFAYNNREHQRLPDQAYQIMNILRRGEYLTGKLNSVNSVSFVPLSTRPASVPATDQARWDRFLREVREAPDRLDQLLVNLPDPRNQSLTCDLAYPELPAGKHLASCRAGELPFAPERGFNGTEASCYVRRRYNFGDSDTPEFFQPLQSNNTGALLGFYGQGVDDEVNDTIMWIRPQNALGLGIATQISETASTYALAALAAPIACFIALFSGSNCLDDAVNLSRQIEPVGLINGAIPGIGNIDGDDIVSTTGVWHFINVETPSNGTFNLVPGLQYTEGGWRGGPAVGGFGRIDALDYGVILIGDSTGLSLDPDDSQGVQRYQQSPDGHLMRRRADWLENLGHIEFEPLDNLALYGWRTANSGARGLGWVLHALGDAVAPHHTIGATGWGHRPFEDFASFAWSDIFSEGSYRHYAEMPAIVEAAYQWWGFIDDWQQQHPGGDVPVRELITALAYETNDFSDWAFQSGVSVGYKDGNRARARELYYSDSLRVKMLLQRGTGATMAFLTKAARSMRMSNTESPCQCAPGQGHGRAPDGRGLWQCSKCSDTNQVELGGLCVSACPADKPLRTPEGRCVSSCPAANCTGVVCPADAPFVHDGMCVAACPPGAPVIFNGRECRDVCPQGQAPVGTSPQYCENAPPQCGPGTRADDSGRCVAVCTAPKPFRHGNVCFAECPSTVPYYRGGTTSNIECLDACPAGTRDGGDHVCEPIIIK